MRRILLVLSVAALMAAMMVAMAAPAMAKNDKLDQQGEPIYSGNPEHNTVLHCKALAEYYTELGLGPIEFRGTDPRGANSEEAGNCRLVE